MLPAMKTAHLHDVNAIYVYLRAILPHHVLLAAYNRIWYSQAAPRSLPTAVCYEAVEAARFMAG